MRKYLVVLLLACTACQQESSPEGRLKISLAKVERRLDSLTIQQQQLRDSLEYLKREIKTLSRK